MNKVNKKPNFLVVGAPKAGTTSIAKYMNEHPEIFISEEKEPFYFLPNILEETNKKDPMYDSIKKRAHLTAEKYYRLFENVVNQKKIGEATVHYLYHYEEVIPRVKEELGDIEIIIVLRNPIERAFSNYKYQTRGQVISFEKALKLEEKRKENNFNSFWFYKGVGNYYLPVKAYLEHFSKVHICFFEDLKENPLNFMKDIYSFLEVDDTFIPSVDVKHNLTTSPTNKLLHYIYYLKHRFGIKMVLPKKINSYLKSKYFKNNTEIISVQTSNLLKDYFKQDIEKLEKLLDTDLSNWYSKI